MNLITETSRGEEKERQRKNLINNWINLSMARRPTDTHRHLMLCNRNMLWFFFFYFKTINWNLAKLIETIIFESFFSRLDFLNFDIFFHLFCTHRITIVNRTSSFAVYECLWCLASKISIDKDFSIDRLINFFKAIILFFPVKYSAFSVNRIKFLGKLKTKHNS